MWNFKIIPQLNCTVIFHGMQGLFDKYTLHTSEGAEKQGEPLNDSPMPVV